MPSSYSKKKKPTGNGHHKKKHVPKQKLLMRTCIDARQFCLLRISMK